MASQRKVKPSSSSTSSTDLTFKKDSAKYDYYNQYIDKGKLPPLPSNIQVQQTEDGGQELVSSSGASVPIDFTTQEGKNAFYSFMGLDHRVWAGDFQLEDVDDSYSE